MKKLTIILLLCLPAMLFAQAKLASRATTPTDVLYILDGKEATGDITKAVSPDSIVSIDVLKDGKATALYGIRGAKGVVVVTTLAHAAKQYQEVFSSFSDDFESWLTSHGTDDAQFRYYLNGSEVPKTNAGKLILYGLTKDQIESVTMVQDEPAGSKYAAKIKIITKK